jgi:hypothetical protein
MRKENRGSASGIERIGPTQNILRRVLGDPNKIKGEGDRNADWNFE